MTALPPTSAPSERPCKKCGVVLPLEDFSPGNCSFGRRSWCKPCERSYRREKYNPKRERPYAIKYGRKNRDRIRQTRRSLRVRKPEVYKATLERNRQAAKARPKPKRDPIKDRARARLHLALKKGTVVRPKKCEACSVRCKPDGHHHKGYTPKHALDVQWLCRLCHRDADYGRLTLGSKGKV